MMILLFQVFKFKQDPSWKANFSEHQEVRDQHFFLYSFFFSEQTIVPPFSTFFFIPFQMDKESAAHRLTRRLEGWFKLTVTLKNCLATYKGIGRLGNKQHDDSPTLKSLFAIKQSPATTIQRRMTKSASIDDGVERRNV